VSRHDRFGERIDDEPLPLAFANRPVAPLRAESRPSGVPVPDRVCELCTRPVAPSNASHICAECTLIVRNRLGVAIPERWRDHPDGEHIVSERGRIARLLNVDRAHRYPRVAVAGQKRYVHAMVAEAWHGARPEGALVLHHDDDPDHPHADNLRYGTHADNAADARRNKTTRHGAGGVGNS
jgi:hypothetical protein